MISNSKKIAVLTGAGMSTESDLPDFRSREEVMATLTEWERITAPNKG